MAVNYNIPLQTQLEYMMQELQGPESKTLDAFGSGTAISPQDYAEMFEKNYERSGGEGMGKRRQYALEIFAAANENELGNLPDNVETAFNFFKGQGFTDAQAAGIVGNLQVESFPMVDPQAYNPEGGGMGAYGIAQFRGPRLKGLLQYAGKQGENTMDGNAPFGMPLRATMKQDMPQQQGGMMGGIRGLLDYGTQVNPQTGLNRLETFAAALDPLIMPSMRGGEGIRARGAQRVQAGNLNKTIEWLKANGYEDIATMVAQNPQTASNVMSAILSQKIKPTTTFRVATPEEAAQYGAIAGQFDEEGKFYPTQKKQITEQLTSSELSKAQNASMALSSIKQTVGSYKTLVQEGGIGVMPGTQRDLLTQTRRNLQLQMKELFNLGVLNGPDLELMDQLILDTTNPSNYLVQALTGETVQERFNRTMDNLLAQLDILAGPKLRALRGQGISGSSETNQKVGSGSDFSVTGQVGK
jgi:hypothetical protein